MSRLSNLLEFEMGFGILIGISICFILIQPVAVVNPPIHLAASICLFVAAGIVAISIAN